MINSRTLIAAVVVLAAVGAQAVAGKNEVRAVSFGEDGGVTSVRVRGATTPTFTVYKLERPTRVVIDIPQARLADTLRGHDSATMLSANTWAVSTIGAQELDDGAVRVIVTLARPGRYDVKTEGSEVVVVVMPRDPAPKTANPAELAQAKQQAQVSEQARVVAERSSAAATATANAAKAEAERLRKLAADQAARADAAQRAADDAKLQLQKSTASTAELERAKQAALAAQAEATRAKAQAQKASGDAEMARQASAKAQVEAERARVMAEQARRDALAEAAAAKADARKARDDMAKAQAQAKVDVDKARAETDKARSELAVKQAEADKVRAELAAKQAESQRAREDVARKQAEADKARAAVAETQKSRDELARKQAEADKAREELARRLAETERARAESARKQAEADRARAMTATDAERAKTEIARAQAAADQARAEADRAKTELGRVQAAQTQAQAAIAKARGEADAAKREAAQAVTAAQRTLAESQAAKKEAEAARLEASQKLADADAAKKEADKKRAEADAARTEVARAKDTVARTQAEAMRSKSEADAAKADAARARSEAEAARAQAAAKRAEADAAKLEVAKSQDAAAKTRAEAEVAKAEAARAKSEAAAARAQAAADKRQAEADKQAAELARKDAQKMADDAKQQLASLEQKTVAAQQLDDKARTTLAAAQAREEAARELVAKTNQERAAAEAAAKKAQAARDQTAARAAEDRLATARRATQEAEARRVAAEQAARAATQDLEHTKTALATVEQQRAAAVAATTDAARKRAEAEAAASDATRRRHEAEVAATEAAKRKGQAETERLAAQQAAQAADKQRKIAEAAAQQAMTAKQDAETALAALTAKQKAAERAADELATRTRAEAKAQAQIAAAQARQAGEAELATARRELAKLSDDRKRAEADLADRRKAVATAQAESTRLATAAAQARDAADREDGRRTQLVQQRVQEEQDLARIKAQKVQAQVATTTAKPAKVQNITFKGNADSGVVEIAMAGDGHVQLGDITAQHVELIVDNAELAAALERTLDVSKFGSPVRKISTFRDRRTANRVRLVAELGAPAIPTVVHDAGMLRWRFAANTIAAKPQVPGQRVVIGGFGAASTPLAQQSVAQVPPAGQRGRRVYHGATVDLDFNNAPLHDLLRILSDTGGVSIVVPDTIDAKVTVKLKHVPWDQALDVILASHGLWYRRDGNIYRVATRKEIDTEDEAEAARRAAAANAEMPRPEIVTLNYASADELKTKLEGMKSPKGTIEVDGRSNSLIINDIAANRESIAKLATALDTQTPQITIEARIVEARSNFSRQFGIQWGGRALMGAATNNATGLVFPSSVGVVGGNDDPQTRTGGISALPSDFAVNLPALTGTGEGGAIGLSLGSVSGNFNINLRLSALEDTGTVRIISAPKITVLNNKSASIKQGVSIPISVVSAAGTQTQFVQADLSLLVTPYVSQKDCAIAMNLEVAKNEPDFVNTGARGDPTILRKEAKTTMLVADGETSVLGGIYTRNSGLSYKKVPFLADIPVLGWLFKFRSEIDDRTEILVFITPKITNKAALPCMR